MARCCFKQGCELEVQYACQCLSSVTYFCEFHLQAHLKLPNRIHSFDSILTEPSEFTKDIVLKFLEKEKAKNEKLKKIAKAFLNKYTNNTKIKSGLNDLKSDLKEISCLIEKISQVSENDSLNSLVSQQDADKKEEILKNSLDEYSEVRLFCKLSQLRNKRSEILNRANNDLETEQDFRRTCPLYENQASDSLFNQFYQEFIEGYQKIASIHFIYDNSVLYIYNTEIEKEEIKYFDVPEKINYYCCPSTQLPNGELFFIGSRLPFILDINYQIRKLPRVELELCFEPIYFDKSIYIIGGRNNKKFDLIENRWTNLPRTRKDIWNYSNSVVFNRNILISIDNNRWILLYSIDIDSYSELPFIFGESKKILINAEGKLYLIERIGFIYESENEYGWKRVTKSIIDMDPERVYCSYNKGGIYISILTGKYRNYFKFDLNRKALIDVAFYNNKFALQRSGDNFEKINHYDNIYELSPNDPADYIDKGYSLHYIHKKLEKLSNKIGEARTIADEAVNWAFKGNTLCDLGIYLGAIEFYNKSIEIDTNYADVYNNKGCALQNLGRHLEAIECYNESIKLAPDYLNAYNNKGKALQKLGKHIEAIECYNEVIKLKPDYAAAYNGKGEALYNLERNIEAIECYNEAIKLKIDEPVFYRNRANAFKNVGRHIEALLDFNKAKIFD